VKSEVLEIRSWKSVKQFEAMKDCLQTGLQEHIKYNNMLRAMLNLPETLEDRKVDRVSFSFFHAACESCVAADVFFCSSTSATFSTRSQHQGSSAAMN
jgi:hypothetical protein